jgi:hypothetical protein
MARYYKILKENSYKYCIRYILCHKLSYIKDTANCVKKLEIKGLFIRHLQTEK